jgi:hypothetical protein
MGRPLKKHYLNRLYVYANVDGTHTDSGEYIVKQSGSRSYKVTSNHGTAVCHLVASDTPAHYQMYTVAKDSNNNTYWVIKLTRHRATLIHRTKAGAPPYQFANSSVGDEAVEHVFGEAPVTGKTVQLVNYD